MDEPLHIGIVGAGIGGVMASIAIARAGGEVTILEAAHQLGEIGAGIQMTPNVSRLLIKYGVDEAIGSDLVKFRELNLRRKDGTKLGFTSMEKLELTLGYPWWLVHRHHLHNGLVEVAQQNDVKIFTSSRVSIIRQSAHRRVTATTTSGSEFTFDLLIGSDGVQSIVRKSLFPDVTPKPPSGNCAYRAIVPVDDIRKDPATRELVEDENGAAVLTMEVWMAPTGYIISYPISNGRDFNMVLSHFREQPVDTVQAVNLAEVKREYKGYDTRIRRVIDKISQPISRWPLLVTGPLPSWSNDVKNIVLIGDAAHSMTNHMAQGAATSMEDGAYLARCLKLVIDRQATISDAIGLYEKGRMPHASYKQQLSFLNGWIWHLPDGAAQQARDFAMQRELNGESPIRSPNLYGDPTTILRCYGYDAEKHADEEIAAWLNGGTLPRDATTSVTKKEADSVVNWCLPEGTKFIIKSQL